MNLSRRRKKEILHNAEEAFKAVVVLFAFTFLFLWATTGILLTDHPWALPVILLGLVVSFILATFGPSQQANEQE